MQRCFPDRKPETGACSTRMDLRCQPSALSTACLSPVNPSVPHTGMSILLLGQVFSGSPLSLNFWVQHMTLWLSIKRGQGHPAVEKLTNPFLMDRWVNKYLHRIWVDYSSPLETRNPARWVFELTPRYCVQVNGPSSDLASFSQMMKHQRTCIIILF